MFNVRTHMSRGWISVVRGEAAAVVVEVDGEIADRYWRNRIMVTRTESVGQGPEKETLSQESVVIPRVGCITNRIRVGGWHERLVLGLETEESR